MDLNYDTLIIFSYRSFRALSNNRWSFSYFYADCIIHWISTIYQIVTLQIPTEYSNSGVTGKLKIILFLYLKNNWHRSLHIDQNVVYKMLWSDFIEINFTYVEHLKKYPFFLSKLSYFASNSPVPKNEIRNFKKLSFKFLLSIGRVRACCTRF